MFSIVETARYLPGKVVLNKDLVLIPERFRSLIGEKAGILGRHHAAEHECTSDIGASAVKLLLEKSGIPPEAVGALVCATSSPDRVQPATATRIQYLCGLNNAFAFDVNSVCSGSLFSLAVADSLMHMGMDYVVVVASEVYSKILNPGDIRTYPYFGDGAGAVLIGKNGRLNIERCMLGSDGSKADAIQVPAGGTMIPYGNIQKQSDIYFKMNGPEVFEFACSKGAEIVLNMLSDFSASAARIITHQANMEIIREIALRSSVPFERFFVNVDRVGNTAGASVLIALDEFLETDSGSDNILLVAFGGGLSWGGVHISRI